LAAAWRQRQRSGGAQRDGGCSLAAAAWRWRGSAAAAACWGRSAQLRWQQLGGVSGRAVAVHSATAVAEIGCLV